MPLFTTRAELFYLPIFLLAIFQQAENYGTYGIFFLLTEDFFVKSKPFSEIFLLAKLFLLANFFTCQTPAGRKNRHKRHFYSLNPRLFCKIQTIFGIFLLAKTPKPAQTQSPVSRGEPLGIFILLTEDSKVKIQTLFSHIYV